MDELEPKTENQKIIKAIYDAFVKVGKDKTLKGGNNEV